MAELAMRWVADGTIDGLVRAKIEENAARQRLARRILDCESSVSAPTSGHLWLSLPDPWRSEDFVARARVLGVAVSPPGSFVVGRAPAPHAVRLCIGTPPTRAELEQGLGALAQLLQSRPHEALSVV
jgi:DNA-binding transcriptional MocR family regulator